MLDDRPYMRQTPFRFGGGMPWTFKLMIANVLVFVIQMMLQLWGGLPVYDLLALSAGGLARGYLWQLITFQFLHAGPLHLLFNLILIYFFGRAMEQALGPRRMLQLYLVSGALGGLCQVIYQVLLGVIWNPVLMGVPVVGASAGACGLLAAFAALYPEMRITFLAFLVLPIEVKAKVILWISSGLAVFGMLFPTNNVAHAAHFGGIVMGVAFIRAVVQQRIRLPKIQLVPRARRRPKIAVMSGGAKSSSSTQAAAGDEEEFSADFIAREVDPILEKITARGIHSLTPRERRILEAAHKRMRKE